MGLETGTYVNDLTIANPPSSDLVSQGDDHLRLVKTVLKNTFPNATKAFSFPSKTGVTINTSIPTTAQNALYTVDTTAGAITITLPALGPTDGGWECSIMKASYDLNPVFIQPVVGNIRSGYLELTTKARRAIPYVRAYAFWDGGVWYVSRCILMPVASLVPFAGTALPFGHEWANGQTLSTTNYPEYASARGSGTTPDLRGRLVAGKDDMGGVSANRLTGLSLGVNGDVFEATGGEEAHVTGIGEMPGHNHTGVTGGQSQTHTHTVPFIQTGHSFTAGGISAPDTTSTTTTSVNSVDHTHTIPSQGGGGAHNNVQPTIIENYIIVAE